MPKPNQLGKPSFTGVDDPIFQAHYSQLIDTVNTLAGHNGEVELSNHLNLGGNRVTNVGQPVTDSDALPSGVAASKYSASALAPQISPGQPNSMPGYRQINSGSQREQKSSWLNDLISTPPNSNTINPIISSSGGSTTVTIPASFMQMGDGSKRFLPARTDMLSNPADISITSFTVVGNAATIVLSSPPSPAFTDTTVVYISGTGQIDGTYTIASIISPTSFRVIVNGGTSGTGGTVSSGGTYYYYLSKRVNKVLLATLPTESDTPFNRLGISGDNLQLLAVIRINADGGISEESAGGGTPTVTSNANAGSRF